MRLCRSQQATRGAGALRVAAALAIVVLWSAGCAGSDDGGSDQVATDDPPVTRADLEQQSDAEADPGVIAQEEEAAINAYHAAMDARIESAGPAQPDLELPALEETHTEPMLGEWRGKLEGLIAQGRAIRYPENSELEVVEVADVTFSWWVDDEGSAAADAGPDEIGDKATLEVCVLDDGETFELGTGEVVEGGLLTLHETAVLRKVDGEWKLAERTATSREGRQGCAADEADEAGQ